jgi:lipid-A-disaccharide synthase
MARRTPAAVIYRVGRLVHTIAHLVVRLDSITLPNLMSDRKIFPEMVSVGRPEPAIEFLTESIDAMLSDQFYFGQTLVQLDKLRRLHAKEGASARAAEWICQALGLENRGFAARAA